LSLFFSPIVRSFCSIVGLLPSFSLGSPPLWTTTKFLHGPPPPPAAFPPFCFFSLCSRRCLPVAVVFPPAVSAATKGPCRSVFQTTRLLVPGVTLDRTRPLLPASLTLGFLRLVPAFRASIDRLACWLFCGVRASALAHSSFFRARFFLVVFPSGTGFRFL